MKDRLSSMPFFVGDYLGSISVRLMTLTERGAYVHLLCLNWQEGRLQKRPEKTCEINGRWWPRTIRNGPRKWPLRSDSGEGQPPPPSSSPIRPTGQTRIIPFIGLYRRPPTPDSLRLPGAFPSPRFPTWRAHSDKIITSPDVE